MWSPVQRRRGALATFGVLVVAAAAPALADGPTGLRLIQRGTSAGGQTWIQTARADHSRIMVEIEIPLDNGEDGGGIIDGPLRRSVAMAASRGSGYGRNEDEYMLDGFVYRTVRRLRVTTVRRTLTFRPRQAPKKAMARWPQLAKARFFVRFFEADDRPTRIEALDAHGKVVAWEPGVH
jgi:hypothetical protein